MSIPEGNPARPLRLSPASPADVPVPRHLLAACAAKVRDGHLNRKAVVYIRPASPQQVADHTESTAPPDALADLAVALG